MKTLTDQLPIVFAAPPAAARDEEDKTSQEVCEDFLRQMVFADPRPAVAHFKDWTSAVVTDEQAERGNWPQGATCVFPSFRPFQIPDHVSFTVCWQTSWYDDEVGAALLLYVERGKVDSVDELLQAWEIYCSEELQQSHGPVTFAPSPFPLLSLEDWKDRIFGTDLGAKEPITPVEVVLT